MTQRLATPSTRAFLICKERIAGRLAKRWAARGSRLLVDGFQSRSAEQQIFWVRQCTRQSGSPRVLPELLNPPVFLSQILNSILCLRRLAGCAAHQIAGQMALSVPVDLGPKPIQ
jgi:hypothetical protein